LNHNLGFRNNSNELGDPAETLLYTL